MAASFPTSLDAFLNPAPSDLIDAVNPLLDHDYQHGHANDSIAALEAKVGIDSSAVVTSLDYKVATLGTTLTALSGTVTGLGTTKANLASPTFTGTPAAPTATLGTNTTQLASTAFVAAAAALKADLASPALTGTPTSPTAAPGTNTTQISSTAFVTAAAAVLSASISSLSSSKADLASPALTGTPTSPTATLGTNTTQIATTAFVAAAAAALVNSAPGTLDTLNELAIALGNDANFSTTITTALSLKAPLASPALTGTPTAPTASAATSTTQIATTSFVTTADALKANLASPTFTGTPLSTTAAIDTNNTQIATTAYVIAQASASGDGTPNAPGTAARGSAIHWARADHTHPNDTTKANLASPTFTGTPAAPTASAGTNTTQLATTAYVDALVAAVLTFTNKRVTRRVVAVTNSATPTANTDNADQLTMDALNVAITNLSTNLSGTPTDGEPKVWRFKDDGTARALNLGAKFVPLGAALPTTTVISKWLYVGAVWHATAAVWHVVSVNQEA